MVAARPLICFISVLNVFSLQHVSASTACTETFDPTAGRLKFEDLVNFQRTTRFTVDLTAEYQERYPDAGITEALRVEYTSTPY